MTTPTTPGDLSAITNLAPVIDAQASQYRVFTTDVVSGQKTSDWLPMAISSYGRDINATGGTATGVVSLDAEVDVADVLTPRKTKLWIARGGYLVWGGIIWSVTPDVGRRTMQVGAAGHLSYLKRHQIGSDFVSDTTTGTLSYTGVDQFDIVRDLISRVQGRYQSNIGLSVDPGVSGVVRTVSYDPSQSQWVLDALQSLAHLNDGFEYAEDCAWDGNGNPQALLHLGHLQLGRTATGMVVEYPGNVVEPYQWPLDGTNSVNYYTALGAGDGSSKLRSQATNWAELNAGYPLLMGDSGSDYNDVSDQTLLDGHAAEDLAVVAGDQVVPVFTIRADQPPVYGTYALGDQMRARLTSCYHRPAAGSGAPGFDAAVRIVSVEVTPGTGSQDEKVKLAVNPLRVN